MRTGRRQIAGISALRGTHARTCIALLVLLCWLGAGPAGAQDTADSSETERTTLVLAAPPSEEPYYWRIRDQLLRWQAGFARAILKHDDAVILADSAGYDYFAERLPGDMLIRAPLDHVWTGDFGTVMPETPLRFRYTAAALEGGQREADAVQAGLTRIAKTLRLSHKSTRRLLDGGNFVSDGAGRLVVTERFLKDNNLSKDNGIAVLRKLTQASQVAIIPIDDPDGLGHAGAMAMFTDPGTLFINAYREPLRSRLVRELRRAFPDARIYELPARFGRIWDAGYANLCGIYVAAAVTKRAVYLPQFGYDLDARALALVRKHTKKVVVPIDSREVCHAGASPRRLTWQQVGRNAAYLQRAARAE